MRSNGLTASTYTPVADLDPRVAEVVLEDLRTQGVAAYTKPVESTTPAGFDRPEFREGAKDRLYVDAAASARVRSLLESKDPGLIDDNDDLTWAQLVAGFDRPLDSVVAPWPVEEDLQPESEAEPLPGERVDNPDPSLITRWGSRGDKDGSDDDDFLQATSKTRSPDDADRFVPPPPPPLPSLAPYKQAAWIGLIGGPLVMLLATLFSIALPGWVAAFAVVGFIGGFVTLVATMGDHSDGDSDDGAVV